MSLPAERHDEEPDDIRSVVSFGLAAAAFQQRTTTSSIVILSILAGRENVMRKLACFFGKDFRTSFNNNNNNNNDDKMM